ncbi:hypothetical protein BGZ76_000423 [Entomortierella beljakovae]|nr:hypothetical protein BGZ76_000423 [Entomortierella beljakovae]
MGSSASKATSGAKTAARHFPSATAIHEKTANSALKSSFKKVTTEGAGAAAAVTSSPKEDYLKEQKRLEEELARYDEELKKSGKLDGESRPLEDTPSAAELQFFGNLRSIGQVQVPSPDQVKHHEAEEILKRKLPVKPISSSYNNAVFTQSTPSTISKATSGSTGTTKNVMEEGSGLTPLELMNMLQLRNQDPSVWTVDSLSAEFGVKKQDIEALTKYVNTYTILPGKDAKGRETGVWCEDIRGVNILEKPSSLLKDGGEVAEGDESKKSDSTTAKSNDSSSRGGRKK